MKSKKTNKATNKVETATAAQCDDITKRLEIFAQEFEDFNQELEDLEREISEIRADDADFTLEDEVLSEVLDGYLNYSLDYEPTESELDEISEEFSAAVRAADKEALAKFYTEEAKDAYGRLMIALATAA